MRNALTPLELSPQQIEALRQLANLGSSDAARSLGRLLGTSVEAAQPKGQRVVRAMTDKVMTEIQRLSGQEYTGKYAPLGDRI